MAAIAFPSHPTHALLARGLVTWQAMGACHTLEDNFERITHYMDKHCLAYNGTWATSQHNHH